MTAVSASRVFVVVDRNERETCGERLNFVEGGKRFRCNFIEPGLVRYDEVELLKKETIDRALKTAIGNALTNGHVPTRTTGEALRKVSHGGVDKVGYDEATGWYYSEGTIDEAGRAMIRNNGKRPSCGYRVKSFGPGGVWHNMPYAREITEIEFHHLALVDIPRYEGAGFRLNSKNQPVMKNPFKLIWDRVKPAAEAGGQPITERAEAEVGPDATVEIDGKPVRLNEIVATHQAGGRLNEIAPESEIEYTGTDKQTRKVKFSELLQAHEERENGIESPALKAKREAAERESAAKAAADKAAEERQNGKNSFRVLSAARNTPPPVAIERHNSADTMQDKVDRGAARYGSGKN